MLVADPPRPLAAKAVAALVLTLSGTAVCPRTVHHWQTRGCRGHVLPSRLIGGRRYSDAAQVEAFLAAVNAPTSASA